MKAVILAGGLGTRISQETGLRPKPMAEIGGKLILWHIMKIYSHYGVNYFATCIVARIFDVPLVRNATGAGLFDRAAVEIRRTVNVPYPYTRGLVCEIGFPIAMGPFKEPKRKRGITKNNFYILKLVFWDKFQLGIAPIMIGMFFFASLQTLFIRLLGEYIAAIYTRVCKLPLVVEVERVNFTTGSSKTGVDQ